MINPSKLYRLKIRAEEPIFFSTREANKRISTGRFLHNFALTYAFIYAMGRQDELTEYSRRVEKKDKEGPKYFEDLCDLDFYIFPAKPLNVSFTSEKVNTQSEGYREEVGGERGKRYFAGHTVKRIETGSTFKTILLAESEIKIPEYARLGKFMSKIKIEGKELEFSSKRVEEARVSQTLNILDTPKNFEPEAKSLKIEKMRPSPLIISTVYSGPACKTETETIPQNVRYLQKKAD